MLIAKYLLPVTDRGLDKLYGRIKEKNIKEKEVLFSRFLVFMLIDTKNRVIIYL